MSAMALDSGAGEYSHSMIKLLSVDGHIVGTGVVAVQLRPALHDQIVEYRRGSEPEVVRIQPLWAGNLVNRYQITDRVLCRADAAGGLHRSLFAGLGLPVLDSLQHHVDHG